MVTCVVTTLGETDYVGMISELGRGVASERIELARSRGHDLARLGLADDDRRFGAVCTCGWEYVRGNPGQRVGKLTRNLVVGQLIAHLMEVTQDQARAIAQKHADAKADELIPPKVPNGVSIPGDVVPGV